jgi:arsenite methyltransferase
MLREPDQPGAEDDAWSRWLLEVRHAGDAAYRQVTQRLVGRIRDRVLDGAALAPGMTVVDVGAGDGLLAFGAIARVGTTLRVLLTDVSPALLQHAERRSRELGVRAQCSFARCGAETLDGLEPESADVVLTRAVLAYVPDKAGALRQFNRVLRPGGRISLGEPVFRDQAVEALALTRTFGAQAPGTGAVFPRLLQRWKAAQFPATEEALRQSPIANYSERDLVRLAQAAGFVELHLELHIDVRPASVTTWEVFVGSSPHPLAPTLSTIMGTQFSEAERQLFEATLRPLVEAGKLVDTDLVAYLTAVKPPR